MANTQVTLVWRCKTEKGWRYFQPVFASNGRPKKGVVVVAGEERRYPEGRFQLRYYEGDKMTYKDIGPDANKALDGKHVLENLLATRTTAAAAGVQIVEDVKRKTLAKAYEAFLQSADDRGCPEAKDVYRLAVDEFFQVIRKTYVDELTAEDMLKYMRHLRQRGCADRTIYNRWANTKAFYISCGLDPKAVPREDGKTEKLVAPKYEEQTPEVYDNPDELKRFFRSIENDDSLYAACQIMLKCGLREKEAQFLEWQNVNLKRGILHVEGNPRHGFKVKDSEQRDIPIPEKLVEWLQTYRKAHPGDRLVCPTSTGKPNGNHLRLVKAAAKRAGLNCNACSTCVEKDECCHWYLHRFRATAVTLWLRSGMDLRTVMRLSGHADLGSVMRYLSPANDESVRVRVNGIDWGD